MLFGSREEKEQYVIELHKQGKTIREIAHEAHMAFAPICAIINKFNGEDESKNNKQEKSNTLSKHTQAFKLFSKGRKPVEVIIELDMAADEVSNLYQQFWRLERLYRLTSLYQKLKHRLLPSFLKLSELLEQHEMLNEESIARLLNYANHIPLLESQIQQLYEDIHRFEEIKTRTFGHVSQLLDQQSTLERSLKECQLNIEIKRQEEKELNEKLTSLECLINNIKDTEDHKEIEKIVEQKANEILTDNKVIVSTALISVIEAIKINSNNTGNAGLQSYPAQQVLTNGYCYFGSISFPIEQTLKLAEKIFYQELSEMFVNNVLYSNRKISPLDHPRDLPH